MSALNYRNRPEDGSLEFYFSACERESGTWKEELYAAARNVANKAKKPLMVCSSGGIDSEVMCRAFFDQGINFSVLIAEHLNDTNHYDIDYAIRWCRDRGVTYELVQVDMKNFFDKEVDEYARKYVAIHPFRYFQVKLIELVEERGGYAVLACGDPLYKVDVTKPKLTREDVYLPFGIGGTAPLKWCEDNHAQHEPYFLYATPELCLSYLRLPIVNFALNNPESVFRSPTNSYTFKRVVYMAIWPDFEPRYKSDGLRHFRNEERKAIERLAQKFGDKLETVKLPVIELEMQLEMNLKKHI